MTPDGPDDKSLTAAIGGDVQRAQDWIGNVGKGVVADTAAGMRALKTGPKEASQFSGNIPAAVMGKPLPVDSAMRDAAEVSSSAATTGKVALGIGSALPLIAAGMPSLPSAIQKLVGTAFALSALPGVKQAATDLGTQSGLPKEQQDPDAISTAKANLITDSLFALAGGHGALKPEASPTAGLNKILETSPINRGVESYAIQGGKPNVLDVTPPPKPPEPWQIYWPKIPMEIKGERPPVEETPKPKADIPFTLTRQEVPATAPEPERGINVLQELRQKGANTKAKVQEVFPHLSREEAGALVKQAFPNGPEAYALPEKPEEAPPQPAPGPLGLPAVETPAPKPVEAPKPIPAPKVESKNLPQWAREEMQSRGLDPNRPLNDQDLQNPSIVEAIKTDPTLTDAQKEQILKTGSPTPQNKASVPVMITRQMEADLRGKGYTQEQINAMKPDEAGRILQGEAKPTPETPSESSAAPKPVETPPQVIKPAKRKSKKEAAKEAGLKAAGGEAEESKTTSIKNDVVDQERETRGVPPAIKPLRKAFGEAWDKMTQKVASDKGYQDRLITELKNKPRAITDEEDAAILHRQVELQNEYGKATKQLAEMTDSGKTEGLEDVSDRIDALSDQLQDVYNVGKQAGTETARGLAARRMMVNEDFTLSQMELTRRAEKGGAKLTPEERSYITNLHDKMEKTQKAHDEYVASTQEKLSQLGADKKIAEMKAAHPQLPPKVVSVAKSIVERFNREGNAASQRLHDRLKRTSASVDPTILLDVAEVLAKHAANGVETLAEATAKLVSEFGEAVRPYAEKAWEKANEKLTQFGGAQKEVKKALKSMSPEEQVDALTRQIAEKAKGGDKADYGYQIQKLARSFVQQGVTDRNELVDLVHDAVSKADPAMTRRDTMDSISGYGQFKQLTKDQVSVQLRDIKGQLQQIGKLEDMEAGSPPLKTGVERREPSKVEADLIKLVNDAKKKYNIQTADPSTQLISALDEIKKRLTNKTAEFEKRLANNDFETKPRRIVPLDQESLRLKAENEKAKEEWRRGREKERLSKRTTFEKAVDLFGAYRRFNVLTSPAVVPKLAAAAAARGAITPIEEATGGLLGKIPGIKGIAERAPREGGFSMQAELRSGGSLKQGIKDAFQVLRSGESDLTRAAGVAGKHVEIPGKIMRVMELPGRVHSAIKAPVKRAEFERSFIKRSLWNESRGVDITDPIESLRITRESLADSERAIFQDKNKLATWINTAESHFKEEGKQTVSSGVVKLLSSTLLPIKNVPLNIYSEAMNYMFGSAIGGGKAISAHIKGLEILKPEQADQIMRHLKKGAIGPAAVLLGWYGYKSFGGSYERGEKRKEHELKPGEAKIAYITVPKNLQHHPLFEDIQAGAEMHRWAEKMHKGNKNGEWEGFWESQAGLLSETPLVRDAVDAAALLDPHQRGKKAMELGKSILIPQAVTKMIQKNNR